jgi:hypothetical protein
LNSLIVEQLAATTGVRAEGRDLTTEDKRAGEQMADMLRFIADVLTAVAGWLRIFR